MHRSARVPFSAPVAARGLSEQEAVAVPAPVVHLPLPDEAGGDYLFLYRSGPDAVRRMPSDARNEAAKQIGGEIGDGEAAIRTKRTQNARIHLSRICEVMVYPTHEDGVAAVFGQVRRRAAAFDHY